MNRLLALSLVFLTACRLWKADRKQADLVHMKPEMSLKNRPAAIQVPAHVSKSVSSALPRAVSIPLPSNMTAVGNVQRVGLSVHIAKIAQSVVQLVAIDVVNFIRNLVMHKEPSKPMGVVLPAFTLNLPVTLSSTTGSFAAGNPKQVSRFRVIAQDITDRFGDTFASHIKPPFDVVRGLRIAVLSTPILSLALAGCTSLEERDAHMKRQVEIVQVQKNAQASTAAAEANAKAELYKALAAVAAANPEQASAVTVALAVQGLGAEGEGDNSPITTLQPLKNEGLEFARVFAAPVMNMTTAVATAYINADVAKTQSDNAAAVNINDSINDTRIVEAVAGVGIAAAESSGLMVNGDNYTLSDSASISQDQVSTVEETTTTTTETTETTSTSTITDSYNDVTYEGQEFTLPRLLDYLAGTGLAYNLTIGDTVYTIDGDGTPQTINCGEPDFSPAPPVCSGN